MKLLDRYILWSFLKNYLISFMVLVGLYVLLDLVFNLDELIEVQTHAAGATTGAGSFFSVVSVIGDYYFYQIFLIFAQLSGVIPVVAAAFTIVRLARFNELSAILAAGVPLLRLITPIVFASIFLTALLIVDQNVVVPALIPKLMRSHDQAASNSAKSYPISFMQDDKGRLLKASLYTPPTDTTPAQMEFFDLLERDENFNVVAHTTADRAEFDPSTDEWKLTKGRRVTGMQPGERRSRDKVEPVYKSNITPEEIALYRSGDYVELLSTNRIDELLQRPQSYGTIALLRVKHTRLTNYLMNIIVVLLGIGCVLTREPGTLKTNGIKLMIVVGLALGVVFLSSQIAGHPPGDTWWTDRWPALMAWVPIIIFGPMAIWLLDQVHTKKS